MPVASCLVQSTSFLGGISFPSLRRLNSGPYGQYSITMQYTGDWVHTPLEIRDNGWMKRYKLLPSYLNCTIFGCISFLRCFISVSNSSLTFLTATNSPLYLPEKTAPWAPDPNHCRSLMFSKGISQSSANT